MQSVLGGALQTAYDTMTSNNPLVSNKKVADLKKDTAHPGSDDRITSDWGTRQKNTDVTLSASTNERKGPQLLEDGFAREKVGRVLLE